MWSMTRIKQNGVVIIPIIICMKICVLRSVFEEKTGEPLVIFGQTYVCLASRAMAYTHAHTHTYKASDKLRNRRNLFLKSTLVIFSNNTLNIFLFNLRELFQLKSSNYKAMEPIFNLKKFNLNIIFWFPDFF